MTEDESADQGWDSMQEDGQSKGHEVLASGTQ